MSEIVPSSTDRVHVDAESAAAVKAASGWVANLSRTLKTCRLYDASNPAVIRFRAQLHEALRDVLGEHGEVTLRFTSDDVLYEGVSLHPARSREDNLALAFFRDGVRAITFKPGIEPQELDQVLNGVLQVTGQADAEDDLVTLLWQANLPHVQVEHIQAEADAMGPAAADAGEVVPWPTGASVEEAGEEATPAAADAPAEGEDERSDDWAIGESPAAFEAMWQAIQQVAETEVARFQKQYLEERATAPVTQANGLLNAYADADPTPDDLAELGRFVPRVLRTAVAHGDWRGALEAIRVLERCGRTDWSAVDFAQELNQPISVAAIVEWLDKQDARQVADFIVFAQTLGTPGVDLQNLVMVEVQTPEHRAALGESVIEACRESPEMLAAWLADPREWVVRDIVRMLSVIGGPSIVGLLRAVAHHPDERVRVEVVNALRKADADEARPVLMQMLDSESRVFIGVLQSLSDRRDPELSRRLMGYVTDAAFERRPNEERLAIYRALASVGGDEVVPEIEAELHRTSWFNRGPDPHRQSLGRCLARIGTEAAREALERGAKSKKPVVRKACEDALEAIDRNG